MRYLLPLRFLLLFASLGAVLGAGMMFWLAGVKLAHGAELLWASGSGAAGEITATVMGATDAFLFGVVLIVFAYAITLGFVLEPGADVQGRFPEWMHVRSVGELKLSLVAVIIVYLVVDFATDVAAREGPLTWEALVKPTSILLIALAYCLMGALHSRASGDEKAHRQ